MRRAVLLLIGALIIFLSGCALRVAKPLTLPTPTATYHNTPPTLTPTPTLIAGMPEDVPLHPRAYAVQVMRPGLLVVYHVDRPLEEVVKFYANVLQAYGWQQPSLGETIVGSAATLIRFKLNGDQLVLSLRYDPEEKATIVAISVKRAK